MMAVVWLVVLVELWRGVAFPVGCLAADCSDKWLGSCVVQLVGSGLGCSCPMKACHSTQFLCQHVSRHNRPNDVAKGLLVASRLVPNGSLVGLWQVFATSNAAPV